MDLSLQALEEALSIRRQITTLEDRLKRLFGGSSSGSSSSSSGGTSSSSSSSSGSKGTGRKRGGRRSMSPEAREKIAAAARARWARQRAGQGGGSGASKSSSSSASAKSGAKSGAKSTRRGRMSPAARKRLSEMMKARWAARRKGSK